MAMVLILVSSGCWKMMPPARPTLPRASGQSHLALRLCSLSPLAIRAFTPVLTLWRGFGRGALHRLRLVETPPHPNLRKERAKSDLSPQAGRGEGRDHMHAIPPRACG